MQLHQQGIKSRAMLIHHCASSGAVDLTVHPIHYLKNGEQAIGEGCLLGAEEKAEIVNILNNDCQQSFSLLNDKVLARTPYALAWWMPKGPREITFREEDGNALVSFVVTFPTVVGAYVRGQLYFAVTKGGKSSRPEHDTPLFHIPLPNLYAGGVFCRGNAQLPATAHDANLPAWQSFVFETVNTHIGNIKPLRNHATMSDIIESYREAEESKRFPVSQLVPMGLTLSEWLERLDQYGRPA